jgi:predicted transcriptional regulator YheO
MSKDSGTQKFSAATTRDREILDSMIPVVDSIARMMGGNCEVLLHSFESLDRSVIHIVNGHITHRTAGSPITDLGMKILNESAENGNDIRGCYFSKTSDGKTLRSVTTLIRNGKGKPIGMMCINFNMSASLADLINDFSGTTESNQSDNMENFVTNIEDLVKTTLRETINSINGLNNIPNHEKNKTIVFELIKKGIFDIRGAIDIAARELSLSRYTIYNYIRDYKFLNRKEPV